ncbi:MAG: PRC-barrel domain-containing protein [Aphanothece sp. CMT-3BRIN-NPC111]|nr:PRC-barrel domain-containing protein [Aphanothece sp. CMT-3BRIN-NPC111]
MLKGNDIIGMPIVAHDTGEEIKKVKDLIFDHNSKFLGFVVDENIWLRNTEVLPIHSVKVIGPDAIVASSETAIASASRLPEIKPALERNIVMVGTKIVTEEGYDLGTIIDLYFDKQTGAIEGYEVFGGLFADPYCGLSFVPAPQNLKIGEDVAFVPREIAEMMEERINGINSTLQAAAENFPSTQHSGATLLNYAPELSEKQATVSNTVNGQAITTKGTFLVAPGQQVTPQRLDEVYQTAGSSEPEVPQALPLTSQTHSEQRQETPEATREKLHSALSVYTVEQTLGLRVRRSIKTQEGVYVAALGQIITEKLIARAKMYRQERELIAAVCLTRPNTSEQLYKRALSPKKNVGSVGKRIKEIQERSAQAIEKWRIKRAVGFPVNRVILDKYDNVILDAGELITYKAIEQARQASVLSILLSSVHSKNLRLSEGHRKIEK